MDKHEIQFVSVFEENGLQDVVGDLVGFGLDTHGLAVGQVEAKENSLLQSHLQPSQYGTIFILVHGLGRKGER